MISRSVFIGTYLICSQSADPSPPAHWRARCPNDDNHHVNGSDKFCRFCRFCGAQVTHDLESYQRMISYGDVLNGERQLTHAEHQFLNEAGFSPFDYDNIGWYVDGSEIIGYQMTHIGSSESGVHSLDLEEIAAKTPSAEQLAELQRIFSYVDIEVKCGVLISIT